MYMYMQCLKKAGVKGGDWTGETEMKEMMVQSRHGMSCPTQRKPNANAN
jgi:hypothetical protein